MSKTRIQQFFLSLLLGLLLVEVLIFAPEEVNSSRHLALREATQAKADEPEQTLVGMQVVETKNGKKEWELWSEKAYGSKDQGDAKLEVVKSRIFGELGASYLVTGDRGSYSAKTKDLEVEGNVIIRSSNGYTFTTSKVTYISERRELLSPAEILMRGSQNSQAGHFELRGRDLLASLSDGKILVRNDVKASKEVSNGQIVKIQSRNAEFSSGDQSAVFNEDVVVDMNGSRITGPKARFEFDRDKQTVRSLVVDGGARVTDLERWATAKKVEMLFQSDQFILSGAPRVIQNADELTGEEIIYSHGGKEIQVHGVRARFEDADKRGTQ